MATYMAAAVLVRAMDAGATVGIVLLCSGSSMPSPLRTAGLLGAALTAPHVLGFLTAPLLDRARDPRRVVGAASVVFATLLAAATTGLATAPLPLVFVLCLGAGSAGPLLTGGLSSLVEGGRADERTRRNRALDALTYGVAGAAAPALVAVIATLASPRGALLTLCGLGFVGAGLVTRLPITGPEQPVHAGAGRPRARAGSARRPADTAASGLRPGLLTIWRDPGLRQVALLTWWGAFVVAAALLAGMSMGERDAAGHGGWIAAAFGVGGLAGGLLLAARPLRTDPARGMLTWVWLLVPVLGAGAALGPSFPVLLAVFTILGLVVAPQTVLSLAARGEYAPAATRGTVFVAVAGTKVAFSSAGTAAAGLAAGLPPTRLLAALGAATVGAVTVATLAGGVPGRRRDLERPPPVPAPVGEAPLGDGTATP
jgi:hypothetical protein